jgi:hypothetical protein
MSADKIDPSVMAAFPSSPMPAASASVSVAPSPIAKETDQPLYSEDDDEEQDQEQSSVPVDDTTPERVAFYADEFLTEFELQADTLIPTTDDGTNVVNVKAKELFIAMISKLPRRMRNRNGMGFISLRYTLKSGLFLDIILESAKTNPHGCLTFSVFNKDGQEVNQGVFANMSDYCPRMPMRDIPGMPVKTYKTVEYVKTHVAGDDMDGDDSEYDSVDDAIPAFDPQEIARQKAIASLRSAMSSLDQLLAGPLPGDAGYAGNGEECVVM